MTDEELKQLQELQEKVERLEAKDNQPQLGMGWYKFMIYFLLWVWFISNVYYGIVILCGSHYIDAYGNNYSKIVYSRFSSLQVVDIVVGLLMISLGVFAIVVRQKLAKFSKKGPILLYSMYLSSIIVGIVYLIAFRVITGLQMDVSYLAGVFIGSIAMLIINFIYFSNRKDLFVN